MGSSAKTDNCAFTKAVEHFGDRWSYLIVREQLMPTLKSLRQWAEKWVPEDPKPDLAAALPGWFLPVARNEDARSHLSLPEPELAIEAAG